MKVKEIMNENVQIVNIHIGGKCNFNCKMCAYEYYRTLDCLSVDIYENILNQIYNFLLKYENRKIILCFIGGETTLDLEKLVHFSNLASNTKKSLTDRFYLAITTNGYYGKDINSIQLLEQLNFDVIQLSCSEDHYKQGNGDWIKNIWANSNKNNIWISYIGIKNEVKRLYSFLEDCSEDNIISYRVRNNIFSKDMISKYDCIFDTSYAPKGIYVTPIGIYPVCPGEANKKTCYLGDLNQVEKCLNKTFNCKTEIKINGDILSIIPVCLYLKHCFNLGVSCINNDKIEINIKDKDNIEIKNFSRKN